MQVCACTHITVIILIFLHVFDICMYKNNWKVYFLYLCKGFNKLISTFLVHWNVWKYSDHVVTKEIKWFKIKVSIFACLRNENVLTKLFFKETHLALSQIFWPAEKIYPQNCWPLKNAEPQKFYHPSQIFNLHIFYSHPK